MIDTAELLSRCTFPPPGTTVVSGLSGGADSCAMTALAVDAGCRVVAVHVHHGLRAGADDDAAVAATVAAGLGAEFRVVRVQVGDGPNLEARARAARRAALGPDAMTGHTADDQAETVLLSLLRGAGATGLAAITPGRRHPILGLRRAETRRLCLDRGLQVADDPSNADPRFRRNQIRHDLLPLLDRIAERDVVPLLNRTAELLRRDDALLDELAAAIDPSDVTAITTAPVPLAARAIRSWLAADGYPPDAATVGRVLAVARGAVAACEVGGGRRVERHGSRLLLCGAGHATG
jgi:tRNA(Ile)-lysidine synthase